MVEPKNPFRPTEIEQYVTLDGAIAHWVRDGRYPLLVSYLKELEDRRTKQLRDPYPYHYSEPIFRLSTTTQPIRYASPRDI